MDENMNGSAHAGNLMKACAGRLAFLYRNSSLLDKKCRQLLCSTLIQSYFDYCCSSWYSGLSLTLKERLNIVQRKMVRFVSNLDNRAHVDNRDLRELACLSVPDRVKFLVADTQLYKRLCPSVRPLVRRAAGPLTRVEKWKNERFEAFCVCVCVGKGVGCGWGLAAPAHLSATIL